MHPRTMLDLLEQLLLPRPQIDPEETRMFTGLKETCASPEVIAAGVLQRRCLLFASSQRQTLSDCVHDVSSSASSVEGTSPGPSACTTAANAAGNGRSAAISRSSISCHSGDATIDCAVI